MVTKSRLQGARPLWVAVVAHATMLTWMAASAIEARAVMVPVGDPGVTSVAPADDPGWNNVLYRGPGSGVYLGNRWVLTAAHVGTGQVKLNDGRYFEMVADSAVSLTNQGIGAPGAPDLRMYRLTEDPGLPALTIATQSPAVGATVYMIGAGRSQAAGLTGWHVAGTGLDTSWTEVPLPVANTLGYRLAPNAQMRWGMNEVVSNQILINGVTAGFATRFDRPGLPFEAQAVLGDSGGGVFQRVDNQWMLVGMMTNQQLQANQPPDTVVVGNQTQIADLAAYRSQILALLTRSDPDWQNARNYLDVDGSGYVSPLDALLVINELMATGSRELTGAPPANRFLDVTGDGLLSPLDALRVINYLMENPAEPLAAPAAARFVPEPASGALAAAGMAMLLLMREKVRRLRRGAC